MCVPFNISFCLHLLIWKSVCVAAIMLYNQPHNPSCSSSHSMLLCAVPTLWHFSRCTDSDVICNAKRDSKARHALAHIYCHIHDNSWQTGSTVSYAGHVSTFLPIYFSIALDITQHLLNVVISCHISTKYWYLSLFEVPVVIVTSCWCYSFSLSANVS